MSATVLPPILPEHIRGLSAIEIARQLNMLRQTIVTALECATILDSKFNTLSIADKMRQVVKDTDPPSTRIQPTPA